MANKGKKGAVHIDIPKCISSDGIDIDNFNFIKENTKVERNKFSDKLKSNNFYKIAGAGNVLK